ncbi:hypothetical protein ACFTAO_22390 [Paenibacillus rhizoplanae]
MRKQHLLVLATVLSAILTGCTGGDNKDQALNDPDSVHSIAGQKDDVRSLAITDHNFQAIQQITFTKKQSTKAQIILKFRLNMQSMEP